jgi:magnesium-transporting ATPase (P-type)
MNKFPFKLTGNSSVATTSDVPNHTFLPKERTAIFSQSFFFTFIFQTFHQFLHIFYFFYFLFFFNFFFSRSLQHDDMGAFSFGICPQTSLTHKENVSHEVSDHTPKHVASPDMAGFAAFGIVSLRYSFLVP